MAEGKPQTYPELVFGLVGAVGIDFEPVINALRRSLGDIGYDHTKVIRLSQLLRNLDVWDGTAPKNELPEDQRISMFMTAGNKLREHAQRGDALIGPAVEEIWKYRGEQGKRIEGKPPEGVDNCAYILQSLKHPDEVRRLQTLYGPGFVLIAVHLPEDVLVEKLKRKIAETSETPTQNADQFNERAQKLLSRDSYEPETKFGQNVRDTFAMADLFVDSTYEDKLNHSIQRFIELMFSHPNYTPTRDEASMYHAYSAALLSASLNRQVGASITTQDGQVIAFGVNEVPKPGGGFYWGDTFEADDDRDFRRGYDSNEIMQNDILQELINKLTDAGWMLKDALPTDIYEIRKKLKGSRLLDLIEFHRAVHAETAALLDSARRGLSVQGCTLYCTTFPCHNCAGHIIAAGINRVVYIEPYPKSKARDFYTKAFSSNANADDKCVLVTPFVGVGPRRYRDLFSITTSEGKKIERMNEQGQAVSPDGRTKMLKWGTLYTSQFDNEAGFLESLQGKIGLLNSQTQGEPK